MVFFSKNGFIRGLINSSFVVNKNFGDGYVKFLTLTSAEGMNSDIMVCFECFKNRVKTLSVDILLKDGYISDRDVGKFYSHKELDECFSFEYICVRTDEGVEGVLHILYYGEMLPHRWIKDNWFDINGVAFVKVTEAFKIDDKKSSDKVAGYVSSQLKKPLSDAEKVSNYVSSQVKDGRSSIISYCYSNGFCIPDFEYLFELRFKQWYIGWNGEGKHDFGFFWGKWCKKLIDFRNHGYVGLFLRVPIYNDGNKKISWDAIENLGFNDKKTYCLCKKLGKIVPYEYDFICDCGSWVKRGGKYHILL